ncbi:MAG: hypothetical protein M1814_002015 [Vezdaea aestivalis]|nr:MAG: hypothetical protein M1814_002015 [Vezdaea aestivalis]
MTFIPNEVLRLICAQLRHQKDFNTLYCCAQAAKRLAIPALEELYRMHYNAPVSHDEPLEADISRVVEGTSKLGLSDSRRGLRLWENLWESLLLSTIGKTWIPYSHYIKALDLHDLQSLLEYPKHSGRLQKQFLECLPGLKARTTLQTPLDLLTQRPIELYHRIGDMIIHESHAVERLSGSIPATLIGPWVSKLPQLTRLALLDGNSLGHGADAVLHAHCPEFKELSVYHWTSHDDGDIEVDQSIANFFNGLPIHSLRTFEVIGRSGIGALGLAGLANHCSSLALVNLSGLSPEAVSSLHLLENCRSLRSFRLEAGDRLNEQELPIDWLRNCQKLETISLIDFKKGSEALIPTLLTSHIHLRKLGLQCSEITEGFYKGLEVQKGIASLMIHGSNIAPLAVSQFHRSISKLINLRSLRLHEASEEHTDEHLELLLQNLRDLEDLSIGGTDISDFTLRVLRKLTKIKSVTFIAETNFSINGIEEFIAALGPGNSGLELSIMSQSLISPIPKQEHVRLQSLIKSKVGGRLELVHTKDPESSSDESSRSI